MGILNFRETNRDTVKTLWIPCHWGCFDKRRDVIICIQPLRAEKYQRKTLIEIEFGNMIIQRFVHTNELTNAGTEQPGKD